MSFNSCIIVATLLRHHIALAFQSLIYRYTTPEPWPEDQPLISVIIPCYNHGKYLEEAVDSVLVQTWQNLEIIIVDDGSDDKDSKVILQQFTRPKTQIVHHNSNRGLPSARNTGIRQARGKYICCLDADDRLHPTYLEKAMLHMETNLGISIFYSWVQVFGDENRVWYAPQFDPQKLIYHNQIVALAVFRHKSWEDVGGYREEMRLGYEVWEFWTRLVRKGYRGYCIPEKMLLVRRIGKSFVHAAMEIHERLISDMHKYNPNIYSDTSWIERIKKSYRDLYVSYPMTNMQYTQWYLQFQNPKIWHIWESSACLSKRFSFWQKEFENHFGDVIIVVHNLLDEPVLDKLYAYTPYVYVLPHFLPRFAWRSFTKLLLQRTRSEQNRN